MESITYTSTRVTPYVCQTLYQEIQAMKRRELSVSQFILKTDLITLPKFAGIQELTDAEVVNSCISKLLRIDYLFNNTHEMFRQYMEGVGYIVEIDKALVRQGKPRLLEEVNRFGLSSSSILTYMFLGIRGRTARRSKLDRGLLKEEVVREFKALKPLRNDELLESIHAKVEEIDRFVDELRKVQSDYTGTDLLQTIDQLQSKLSLLAKTPTNSTATLKKLEGKLNPLLSLVNSITDNLNDVEESNLKVIESYGRVLDEMAKRMKREDYRTKKLSQSLYQVNEQHQRKEELLNQMAGELEANLEAIDLMIKSTPIEELLQMSQNFVTSLRDLKLGVKNQVLTVQEVESRIRNLSDGTRLLNEVVQELNSLVRRETLLNLSGIDRQVNNTVQNIESLGEKYIKWRDMN